MVDKNFCMSSYLAFRYIEKNDVDFSSIMHHRNYRLISEDKRILVKDAKEIDEQLKIQFNAIKGKKIGLLLSGGMDSACLASYLEGADAYTFRFLKGNFQKEELERAEYYAQKYKLNLHYVDIDWNTVEKNILPVMKTKGAPVHSIEPQLYQAALQAKQDGVEIIVIGDAADYVFGGMDGLYSKDWNYDEFKKRYIYIDPFEVLVDPVDMDYAFRRFKNGNKIDFISFMHQNTDIESYASYENAFFAADISYLDPYEILKMSEELDLNRIRNGESKYLIRSLFKMKYPEYPVPEKNPMPRPVDEYFCDWKGPVRKEFKTNINIDKFTGNQKWLIWCLEKFLSFIDSLENN